MFSMKIQKEQKKNSQFSSLKKINKREIFSHKKKSRRQSKSKLIFIFGCIKEDEEAARK